MKLHNARFHPIIFSRDTVPAGKVKARPGRLPINIFAKELDFIVEMRLDNVFCAASRSLCFTKEHAKLSRLHNDSNILAIGARMHDDHDVLDIVDVWLRTDFEAGRHQKRIEKIEKYE